MSVYPVVQGWGGVPGVVGSGGYREGLYRVLYRYPARTLNNRDLRVRSERYPYPRPNEGNSRLIDEVSQDGSRMGLEWVPE